MTPTLFAKDVISKLADQVEALTKERDTIPALKAERDQFEIAMRGWIAENAPGGWIDNLRKERDALTANHKECVKCLGEALQDRADLAAAAKLALDALEMAQSNLASSRAMLGGYTAVWDKYADAMNALRQAGVQ